MSILPLSVVQPTPFAPPQRMKQRGLAQSELTLSSKKRVPFGHFHNKIGVLGDRLMQWRSKIRGNRAGYWGIAAGVVIAGACWLMVRPLQAEADRAIESTNQAPPETEVIVHLFEWTWPDIAQECETFLGPQG